MRNLGYVTSDCDADNDVFNSHHYLNHTAEQACRVPARCAEDHAGYAEYVMPGIPSTPCGYAEYAMPGYI